MMRSAWLLMACLVLPGHGATTLADEPDEHLEVHLEGLDRMIFSAKEHIAKQDAVIAQLHATLQSTTEQHESLVTSLTRQHERNITRLHAEHAAIQAEQAELQGQHRALALEALLHALAVLQRAQEASSNPEQCSPCRPNWMQRRLKWPCKPKCRPVASPSHNASETLAQAGVSLQTQSQRVKAATTKLEALLGRLDGHVGQLGAAYALFEADLRLVWRASTSGGPAALQRALSERWERNARLPPLTRCMYPLGLAALSAYWVGLAMLVHLCVGRARRRAAHSAAETHRKEGGTRSAKEDGEGAAKPARELSAQLEAATEAAAAAARAASSAASAVISLDGRMQRIETAVWSAAARKRRAASEEYEGGARPRAVTVGDETDASPAPSWCSGSLESPYTPYRAPAAFAGISGVTHIDQGSRTASMSDETTESRNSPRSSIASSHASSIASSGASSIASSTGSGGNASDDSMLITTLPSSDTNPLARSAARSVRRPSKRTSLTPSVRDAVAWLEGKDEGECAAVMTDPSSTPLPPAEECSLHADAPTAAAPAPTPQSLDQMLDSPALLIATAAFDTIEEKRSSPKQSPALLVATAAFDTIEEKENSWRNASPIERKAPTPRRSLD